MWTNRMRILLAAPILAALAFPGGALAQEYTFKLHTLVPPLSSPVQKFLKPWAETIEKGSKGRIRIDIYPSMQLGGRPEQLIDQVKDGVVDMIWTVPGYTPGRFVRSEVFELPYVHTNPVATNLALQDFAERHGEEYADFKVLLLHVHAGIAFHSIRPLRTADDFKGMKIRTPSRTGSWLIEALGAVPIGAPVSQVPELLSKKVVDAVVIPFEIAWALKVHEMVDYHTVMDDPVYPQPQTSVFLFAMNKSRYESLPADLKKLIDDHSGRRIAKPAGETWIEVEKPGIESAKASGEIIRMAPAEVARFRRLVEMPVQKRWIDEVAAKGIDGAGLIKEAKDLIQQHSR